MPIFAKLHKQGAALVLSAVLVGCAAPRQDPGMTTRSAVVAPAAGSESSAVKLQRVVAEIAQGLAANLSDRGVTRIAVIPFTEMDGRTMNYLGQYLSERITNELVAAAPTVDVLERSRIEAVIEELGLGMSGLLDDASVEAAGRALGADAILVGSLASIGARELAGSQIEISARVVAVGEMKAVVSVTSALEPDQAIWDMMERRAQGSAAQVGGRRSSDQSGARFYDDFKPAVGQYRFTPPPGAKGGRMGRYLLNDDLGRIEIRNADNMGIRIQGNMPAPMEAGVLSVTFNATKVYPESGYLLLQVSSASGDGYKALFPRSHYPAALSYVTQAKDQLIWDKKGESFDLNRDHTIALEFSAQRLVASLDGVKVLDVRNERAGTMDTFTIGADQIDCYLISIEIR